MAEIESLAVIGAGRIGRRIARLAVWAGYRTILEDILPANLQRAENEIRGHLGESLALGKISHGEAEAVLPRLEYSGSMEDAARRAELVIEAVPDEMESKLEIFALLDRIARPGTILASTTVTLSVAEIASTTYRSNRILGLRFLPNVQNSEARPDRIEIVRTVETDDETVAACVEVGQRMVKSVVVIKEDHSMP
jgi:3-hydroxybutyryl-CoA dehydrogenase